ncbi:MAG: gephyrin-like molybdotransferase Glp, partial [Candidatus Odinarchaeia archaeon]
MVKDIRMKGFSHTLSIEQSLKVFLSKLKLTYKTEIVKVEDAYRRVLAEDVFSKLNSPAFNRAAMDGYAVKANDTCGASVFNPIRLKVIDRIDAGETRNLKIKEKEAVEIMTGAKVPEGAD